MNDTLIVTATGDRPDAFKLCELWMANQTRKDFDWLVVDDGDNPTTVTMGQAVIRREKKTVEPGHTLPLNMAAAIPLMEGYRFVLFAEDDDFYGPRYVETMLSWLADAPLVGEVGAKYYHVGRRAYRHFTNHTHASLCRTGLAASALPAFKRTVELCIRQKTPSIDMKLWGSWLGKCHKFRDTVGDARLCVGIKGMPGRKGQQHERSDYIPDPDLSTLKLWLGDDHVHYLPHLGQPRPQAAPVVRVPRRMPTVAAPPAPLVIYTAIFGGYDRLKRVTRTPGVRYVCYTDRPQPGSHGWEIVNVGPQDDPVRAVRWHKMHPHELFPQAERSLWVDGSFSFRGNPRRALSAAGSADVFLARHPVRTCILQEADECLRLGRSGQETIEQARSYIEAGHPTNWGLCCGGFILRRHTPTVATFNQIWWGEFEKWHARGASRDQISLQWALRVSGVAFESFDRAKLGSLALLHPHAIIPASRREAEKRARESRCPHCGRPMEAAVAA